MARKLLSGGFINAGDYGYSNFDFVFTGVWQNTFYDFQTIYLKNQSTGMFWFLIVVQGIILPILQEFLATGFLFNYAFRRDSVQVAVIGIIVSGLIFSVLNYQSSLINFFIEALYGMLFAWSYLYSQTIFMPIYLAMLSSVLTVIMV